MTTRESGREARVVIVIGLLVAARRSPSATLACSRAPVHGASRGPRRGTGRLLGGFRRRCASPEPCPSRENPFSSGHPPFPASSFPWRLEAPKIRGTPHDAGPHRRLARLRAGAQRDALPAPLRGHEAARLDPRGPHPPSSGGRRGRVPVVVCPAHRGGEGPRRRGAPRGPRGLHLPHRDPRGGPHPEAPRPPRLEGGP